MRTPPVSPRLPDEIAERVRRSHHEKIVELQATIGAGLKIIPAISIADNITVPVQHGLGRAPKWVGISLPRNAAGGALPTTGQVSEIRDTTHDLASIVQVWAKGWGATVLVDLLVY